MYGYRLGYNIKNGGLALQGALLNYEPELKTYIDGLETDLTQSQQDKLNTFIATLKSSLNISRLAEAFDIMYILAGETKESSYRNIVNRSNDIVEVDSPNWTMFEGSNSDGHTSYLRTNYIPSTDNVVMSKDDCSIGIYSRTERIAESDLSVEFGSLTESGQSGLYLCYKYSSNSYFKAINTPSADPGDTANPLTTVGSYIGVRDSSNTEKYYINKSNFYNSSAISEALPIYEAYILCYNSRGTAPLLFSNKQISFAFIGKALTHNEVNSVHDAFEYYLDSVGSGTQTETEFFKTEV